jgi:hypothetical protein
MLQCLVNNGLNICLNTGHKNKLWIFRAMPLLIMVMALLLFVITMIMQLGRFTAKVYCNRTNINTGPTLYLHEQTP